MTKEKESVDAARDGTNPSADLHPTSSDVERMREALKWALDEIDVLSNMLVKWAYPQGMAMIGREDQFDNYRAACVVRSLKQEGGS